MYAARGSLCFAGALVAASILAVSHDVQVTFLYPSRPKQTILKGLNLTLPARKLTCIMGPSGCGKSTVMSMLMRLYEPLTGKITLDGVDITRISVPFLRSIIGLVQQEPVRLFPAVRVRVARLAHRVFADFVFVESERQPLVRQT
jgi:ABC-type proline/glycine betaine transport system ATPase subunit